MLYAGPRLDDIRRIAVVRANGLGDLIVAEPALFALRQAYPEAHITLIGAAHSERLLRDRPFPVDEVVCAPLVRGVRYASGPDAPPDDPPDVVNAFFETMQVRRFDLAVQLHGGGGHSNLFTQRLGARVTAGAQAKDAPPLDISVPYTFYQHDVLRWLEVVAAVGAPPVRVYPRLEVTPQDLEEADTYLLNVPKPFAALHPGATDPRRRWPPEHFAGLADALARRGVQPGLVGGRTDRDLTAAIKRAAREPVRDLSEALSLSGLVGVLARADLFVGNDSGPRHLAEALGTPTVGVFTKSNLVDVAPLFRTKNRAVVSWRSRCAVCGTDAVTETPCAHNATVLADVDVDEVLAEAEDVLNGVSLSDLSEGEAAERDTQVERA